MDRGEASNGDSDPDRPRCSPDPSLDPSVAVVEEGVTGREM